MHFLEFVKWFEKECDYGWISKTELELYQAENRVQLLDDYIVMKEFTNPLGSIYQFLVRKSCLEQMEITEKMEHQQ